MPDLLEALRPLLPALWLGTKTDELTGGAIHWATVQNQRASGAAPEEAFIRSGNRVIVIRDRFLPWWISRLSPARIPPVVPSRGQRAAQPSNAPAGDQGPREPVSRYGAPWDARRADAHEAGDREHITAEDRKSSTSNTERTFVDIPNSR